MLSNCHTESKITIKVLNGHDGHTFFTVLHRKNIIELDSTRTIQRVAASDKYLFAVRQVLINNFTNWLCRTVSSPLNV